MKPFNLNWLPASLFAFASILNAADFMPLDPGNTWTYRSNNTSETLQISIGLQQLSTGNGAVYSKLTGFTPQPLWVRRGDDGVIYWLNEEFLREEILTDFRPFTGGYWATPISAPCDQGGQAQERPVELQTGGHTYADGREIRYITYNCADTGVASELYVDNLGLARRVIHTFAGPRTFDLVSAKVGPLAFHRDPNVTFRVSLSASTITRRGPNDPVNVDVGIHLQADRAAPLTLHYNTSQRYDIRVSDSQGEIVYLWSSTAIFLPVTGRESAYTRSYTVPLSLNLPDGQYQIEAWLTTNTAERQFAGTTGLGVLTVSAASGVAGVAGSRTAQR